MTDYRCDHGYYAMGRDCPECRTHVQIGVAHA